MTVEVEHLPPERSPAPAPFPTALHQGVGPAVPFLPALPADAEAWRGVLGAARPACPPGLVDRLVARQRAWGAGTRAEANARRLAEPGTRVVVTGQQPGLLGGLLLSFHKAAGAVHLARTLDALDAERAVVPVFWLASEDHDVDEANRLFLLDRQGEGRRLGLPLEADGRSLMHVPVLADAAAALLEEVAAVLPDTERAQAALAACRLPDDADLASWSAVCMTRFLGDAGLVILDPRDLLASSGEAFAALAIEAEEIGRAIGEVGRRLAAAGLAAPLAADGSYVPLFLRDRPDGPRRRVVRGPGDAFAVRGGSALGSARDVAALVRARPELASGDAAGRVFVQDRLLPVAAYVGGPTELAYHAQVRAAHEAVGLAYPPAVPRPSATWVDAKAERAAAAFGTTIPDLLREGAPPEPPPAAAGDLRAALDAWAARRVEPPDAVEAWAAGGREQEAALDRVTKRLGDAVAKAAADLLATDARIRGAGAARWHRLVTGLAPRGRPQDRGLSALSVVARHGVDAFREGLAGLDPLAAGHHLVHLG